MHEKLITSLLAILLALGVWTLQRTFSLSQDMVLIKAKVEDIENEIQNSKAFKGKKNRKKKIKTKETTDRAVQALIIGLALVLLLLVGCENGARHSLKLTEPTDHTTGDDGGKLKYKIIWGSTKHKD